MKTPPPNAQLRSYTEFDFDDNPPFKGELTTMFGQLAMCVNPHAGYGASDRTLWAVVGDIKAIEFFIATAYMFRLSILEIEAKLLSQEQTGQWRWMKMKKWPS